MNVHSTSRNPRNLAELFEIDHVWKLKHIILEILWPKMSWNKLSYANLLYYFFKWNIFMVLFFRMKILTVSKIVHAIWGLR